LPPDILKAWRGTTFTCHDEIEGFFIIVPSIYTFDRIRNDIDIAIFGGLSGMTARERISDWFFRHDYRSKITFGGRYLYRFGHHYHV